MYRGKIVELGEANEIYNNPIHPYTKSLLSAVPLPDPLTERKRVRIPYSHEETDESGQLYEVLPTHFVYGTESQIKKWTR